jgi:hypothetical protein
MLNTLQHNPLKNSLRIRVAAHPTMTVRRTRRDEECPAVLFAACGGEFLKVEHFAERHAYCVCQWEWCGR